MTNFTGGGIAVGIPGSEFGTYTYNPQGNVWQSNLPITTNQSLTANGILSTSTLNVYGATNILGNVTASQTIRAASLEIFNDTVVNGNIQVDGRTTINDNLVVAGTITTTSNIITSGTMIANTLVVTEGLDLNDGNISLNNLYSNTISSGVFTISGNTIASANGTMIIDPDPPGIGGNLTLAASQTTTLGNLNVAGNTVSSFYFGDGSQLINMYGDANVSAYMPSYTGALTPSSINSSIGNIVALTTANVIASSSVSTYNIKQIGSTLNFLNSSGTTISYIDNTGTYNGGLTTQGVTDAIGYTPYNGSTNPNGYVTSASLMGLGFGGTQWNDVTGSRSLSTTYTNGYSYPIMVSASNGVNNGPTYISVVINGSTISDQSYDANGAYGRGTVWFIVPPGATYEVTGSASVQYWWELY